MSLESTFIRMTDWDKIRQYFSEEEKSQLNAAINGSVICPAGVIIDPTELPALLAAKFQRLLETCK